MCHSPPPLKTAGPRAGRDRRNPMAQSLSEHISSVWSAANARWKGEAAEAFCKYYILRLAESAQKQDAAGRALAEKIQALSDALDAAEAELYT